MLSAASCSAVIWSTIFMVFSERLSWLMIFMSGSPSLSPMPWMYLRLWSSRVSKWVHCLDVENTLRVGGREEGREDRERDRERKRERGWRERGWRERGWREGEERGKRWKVKEGKLRKRGKTGIKRKEKGKRRMEKWKRENVSYTWRRDGQTCRASQTVQTPAYQQCQQRTPSTLPHCHCVSLAAGSPPCPTAGSQTCWKIHKHKIHYLQINGLEVYMNTSRTLRLVG